MLLNHVIIHTIIEFLAYFWVILVPFCKLLEVKILLTILLTKTVISKTRLVDASPRLKNRS
jgi:hypothetical protein